MRNNLSEEKLEKLSKVVEDLYYECAAQELTLGEILVVAKSFQDFVAYKCKCVLREEGWHEVTRRPFE